MEKLNKVIQVLEDLKVRDLAVYDFENASPFYNYFVICTTNERQGGAVVSHLKKALEDNEIRNVEGRNASWTLVDAHDIIIHIFREEDRKYYGFDQRLMGIKRIK